MKSDTNPTRRELITSGLALGAASLVAPSELAAATPSGSGGTFLDLLRSPDVLRVFGTDGEIRVTRNTIVTLQGGNPLAIRGTNNLTPAPFTVGNVLRMLEDTRGPGYKDVTLSLFKNVRFNDHSKLELRVEAFNAFNFVNYGDFATVSIPGANTTFTPYAAGVNTNANFGKITTALPARRIQLGARVTF